MNTFKTGVWNMVFVGSKGGPGNHCSNVGGGPYTSVNATPVIAEKPYIINNGASGFSLMVPYVEFNKVGTTPNYQNAEERGFDKVFVANSKNTA